MDSDSGLSDLSSELSSVRSVSPPPLDYPSPQSTQENGGNISSSQSESRKHLRESDDLPPAKKRKSVEPKPRTTVHLDLQSPSPAPDQSSQLGLLLKVLRKRRKIVVIAGAGISTAAGGECCAPIPAAHWIANLLTKPQFPTFGHQMASSTLSGATISSKLPASIYSTLQFIKQTTQHRLSTTWFGHCRNWSATQSLQCFMKC